MKTYSIKQVDVFTTKPFSGNPAGVVTNAVGLTVSEMQKIAKEMNLSETTFVFAPDDKKADFRVRYFTPQSELAIAGHPTIATIHALIEEAKIPLNTKNKQIWLETGVGILPVEVAVSGEDYTITMNVDTPKFEAVNISEEELANMLGTDSDNLDSRYPPQKVSTGIYWLIVPLRTLQSVKDLRPDLSAITYFSRKENVTGITVFTTETEDCNCDLHVRTFAPNEGVIEDPVCGTGNSCVGAYVVENAVLNTKGKTLLTSEQGIEIDRPGRVHIEIEGNPRAITRIKISGTAVTVMTGEIKF